MQREIAKEKIEDRIRLGYKIKSASIRNKSDLERVAQEYRKWLDENCDLLLRLFDKSIKTDELRKTGAIGVHFFDDDNFDADKSAFINKLEKKISLLESVNNSNPDGLKWPEQITFSWLFKHAPIKLWIASGGMLLAALGLGIKLGQTSFIREFIYDEKQNNLTNDVKSEISPVNDEVKTISVVLPETGVNQGSSITTSDGNCLINVIAVVESSSDIQVIVDLSKRNLFEKVKIGERLMVNSDRGVYFIDILRTRGNILDLTAALKSKT